MNVCKSKNMKANCPGCKKVTEHKENIKIWSGRYGQKDQIGKEFNAGWICAECGKEWDSIELI